jgi:hypothetical protein
MRLHPESEAALRGREPSLWPTIIAAAMTAAVTTAVVFLLLK